jgi:hypothetical protein
MKKIILITPEEYQLVKDYRKGIRGVYWGVEDFEHRATEQEEWFAEDMFDRKQFQTAFETMMHEHDYNIGISWGTIDVYLNIYCKIKD